MKKIKIVIFLILQCALVNAQILIKQIGKVHYSTIPSNTEVSFRNDSIAKAINDYVNKNACKDFPDILLYLTDQKPEQKLSNFEQILVYYQKYKGEFFDEYEHSLNYDSAYIGIHIALSEGHSIKAIEAIKYAVDNINKLKKRERKLSKKIKNKSLTDEDLESFNLIKIMRLRN